MKPRLTRDALNRQCQGGLRTRRSQRCPRHRLAVLGEDEGAILLLVGSRASRWYHVSRYLTSISYSPITKRWSKIHFRLRIEASENGRFSRGTLARFLRAKRNWTKTCRRRWFVGSHAHDYVDMLLDNSGMRPSSRSSTSLHPKRMPLR